MPSSEELWAYAKGELPAEEVARLEAELAASPAARAALADVEASLSVLSMLPPAPPMPDAMARRVGARLAEAVDAQGARSFTSWWRSLLSVRVLVPVAAAATVVTGLVVWQVRPVDGGGGGVVVAQPAHPVEVPAPALPAVVVPPRPARPVKAVVASAKNAKLAGAALAPAQVVEAGATVSTSAEGSLWLKLPDGTKAGLTRATDVTLATLDEYELTLEVARGSLAMVVPHREDRLLTVKVGDVEVKDLGTRFLVSREASRVVVAVEEGSVEVKTPKAKHVVVAGHAVAWRDGALDDFAWPTVAPSTPPLPPAPVVGQGAGVAAEPVEPASAAPPPEGVANVEGAEASDVEPPSANPEDEWATLPPGAFPPAPPEVQGVPPPPVAPAPPGRVVTVQPGRGRPREPATGFSLKAVEEHLRELERQVNAPFVRIASMSREAGVRTITRLVDVGDYERALVMADQWLRVPPSPAPEEPAWRRSVLQQKVRSLNHLGRADEALEVQRLFGP